ncbi:hypothetical protein [Leifsonia sp. LS-T14]|uniref:hypothetical protein n=1 Tax=unclassified Leifsonia TaxID=2663824 RepID=UPI0035A6245D
MELASIIINGGLFVATVIAAIVAWRGVADAQEARDDAQRSAEQAATALQDQAAALNEANRIAIRNSPENQGHWFFIGNGKDHEVHLQNVTNRVMHVDKIDVVPVTEFMRSYAVAPIDIQPGEKLTFSRTVLDPDNPQSHGINIEWRENDETESRTTTVTVM